MLLSEAGREGEALFWPGGGRALPVLAREGGVLERVNRFH